MLAAIVEGVVEEEGGPVCVCVCVRVCVRVCVHGERSRERQKLSLKSTPFTVISKQLRLKASL